ncbi:MAG: hypothetical protein ACYS74_23875 [Planctomycetota bacterium]
MRITSVLAVMLAGVLFVFPVVFGVRSDERTNAFLSAFAAMSGPTRS